MEILRAARERIKPDCPVLVPVGSCQLQHIAYENQLEYKRKMVKDLLERIGKLEDAGWSRSFPPLIPLFIPEQGPVPLGKDRDGRIIAGFYEQGSHEVVSPGELLIQHPLINPDHEELTLEILNAYPDLTVYNEKKPQGIITPSGS